AFDTIDVDRHIPVTSVRNDRTFAVIIANEKYQSESLVDFAANDGETFARYCTMTLGLPERNVRYFPNATLNNIRAQINWIGKVAAAYRGEANLIVYYAGHGIPDEESKTAYLLPIDGYGSDVATGYELNELYRRLGAMPAKSITVFIDACFSGAQRSGQSLVSARGVAIKVDRGKPTGNTVVFSAAQGDETAYPYREKKHGLFTYFLLRKLLETGGDATLEDLSEYVSREVAQHSIVVNSKSQTPTVTPSPSMTNWQNLKLK
ncbi:MAG: caspase family protein, partial [Prevotellaceae bacterium]|nr:caspase family protein [Prevotellaceae bacterium]